METTQHKTHHQHRVRCSDDEFLEAVYSSKTYSEISEKTGQKVSTTMARYLRTKNTLSKNGIEIPKMERKKPERTDMVASMVEKAKLLQNHYNA